MNAIDDVRRLLGPIDPARALPGYTAPPPPAPRARPRRWALVVAGAGAAAVVTGALLVNPLATHDTAAAVTPAPLTMQYGSDPAPHAGRYLKQLAERITATPSDATSGRYIRLTTKGWYLDTTITRDIATSTIVPMETQLWLAADGSGRETVRKLPPEPTSTTRDLRPGDWSFVWPGGLPTDPAALSTALGGPSEPVEPLLGILNANRELIPDRTTRAALFRFLSTVDGLAYRGEVTDRAGRRGIAVSGDTPDGGRREVLVFAPDTGELLAHETMTMREPGKLHLPHYPAVVAYTLFLARTHADRIAE